MQQLIITLHKSLKFKSTNSIHVFIIYNFRYLASGESHVSLSFHFRAGVSTIREITTETCAVLWNVLHPRVMPTPDEEKWINIADDFYTRYNFPLCLGAIDGKHIRIKKPNKSGSLYYNYKGFFSIILLAVTDSEGKFVVVDVGSCGSNNDGGIFHKSVFGRQLASGTLGIPTEGTVPLTDIKLPFMFVADDAFPLKHNIMKPFSNRQLTHEKEVFNNRLSRARNVVEGSFGRIAMMWRLLQRPMDVQPVIATDIVKAITVLHNFVLIQEPWRVSPCDSTGDQFQTPNTLTSFPGSNINGSTRSTKEALRVRESLMNYFTSPAGTLPWQNDQCVTRPVLS